MKATYAVVDEGHKVVDEGHKVDAWLFHGCALSQGTTEKSDLQRHLEELRAINKMDVAFFDAALKSNSDTLQKLSLRGISGLSFERLH